MSVHSILDREMFQADFEGIDPGDANTIYATRWGQVFPLVSTGAETRTLAQPNKAGLIVTIGFKTDGGDITLTVTGGYNKGGSTSLTLDTAGQALVFISSQSGTSYVWRLLVNV